MAIFSTSSLAALSYLCLIPVIANADSSVLGLFVRHADKRLTSLPAGFYDNKTVDACAVICNVKTDHDCKSFTYDNVRRTCFVYTVNTNDRDVRLTDAIDVDHYEPAYVKLFQRIPKHRMPSSPTSTNRLPAEGPMSPDDCARRCLLFQGQGQWRPDREQEVVDRCCGFNFKPLTSSCVLITGTCVDVPAVHADDTEFYQRQPDGVLASFINYGMGVLRPRESVTLYPKMFVGVALDQCADQCLKETTFHCSSFDFVFSSAGGASSRTSGGGGSSAGECRLSPYIAASVGGLVVDTQQPWHNHYELAGRHLSQFYAVPYGLVPGHKIKTFSGISPERCAELCLREDSFVCRSFDYQVQSGTECSVSDKTASDAGGLDTNSGLHNAVHHFEMKPLLGCGGNLTADEGDLASVNWPRNYGHHQNCVWNITVFQHKIIQLQFTHLSLYGSRQSSCTEKDDRLIIEEPLSDVRPYCASVTNKIITTKTNQLILKFITNGLGDSQGFRAFYKAEWPCDVYLKNAPGEIASPHWPYLYPVNLRCTWRITAPVGQRIRLQFTDVYLECHRFGHCNEAVDHIRLLDGGTTSAPQVGIYCGVMTSSPIVLSSSRDLIVQFRSDRHSVDETSTELSDSVDPVESWRRGFHAMFTFEPINSTGLDDTSLSDSSRYVRVGGSAPRRDSMWDDMFGNSSQGGNNKEGSTLELSGPDGDVATTSNANSERSDLWAAVAFLLVMLILAIVGLFLLYHHFRQKMYGAREDIVEEHQAHVMEDTPVRMVHTTPITVCTTRRSQYFNNLVDLSNCPTSATNALTDSSPSGAGFSGGTGNDQGDDCTGTDCSPIYEQCGPPLAAATACSEAQPKPKPRRRPSSCARYQSDNYKNTNVEQNDYSAMPRSPVAESSGFLGSTRATYIESHDANASNCTATSKV